jgi:hypothetical protein
VVLVHRLYHPYHLVQVVLVPRLYHLYHPYLVDQEVLAVLVYFFDLIGQ